MRKKVSIQGYEGSFHQVAARLFHGKSVEVIPCDTFREVVRVAASKKESDGGVMAIENSIAGSILPNYNLLQKSNLKIAGEIYLQIRQNLLVNPGVKLEDIKEVHSHTMALQHAMPTWISTNGNWLKPMIRPSVRKTFISIKANMWRPSPVNWLPICINWMYLPRISIR